MRKLVGEYRFVEVVISLLVGGWLIAFNYAHLYADAAGGAMSDRTAFIGLFVNLVIFAILVLPFIARKVGYWRSDAVEEFIGIASNDAPIRFSVFSSFLGDQAVGAFLGTLMVVTGRDVLHDYGFTVSAIYVAVLCVASVLMMVASLVKFISHFRKYNFFIQATAALFASIVMFSFFKFGMKLA